MFNGKTHYSMAMFHSYVKLPESGTITLKHGKRLTKAVKSWNHDRRPRWRAKETDEVQIQKHDPDGIERSDVPTEGIKDCIRIERIMSTIYRFSFDVHNTCP